MNRTPKIHPWNRGTRRKPNYWARYSVKGHEYRVPTNTHTERDCTTWIQQLERQFRLGTWKPPIKGLSGVTGFAAYARAVVARRTARGVGRRESPPNKSEIGHVENHLVPMFGDKPLEDVAQFVAIRDAFKLLEDTDLAGRTVRNIHSTFRSILIEAVEETLLPAIPPPLTTRRGHLPASVDKDPKWRKTAVFDRDELGALLRCEAIPEQYRVMYATWMLTGSRFGEIIELRVSDYERAIKPLGRLTLTALKSRRDKGPVCRVVPVHRDLRAWLEWWLDTGYAFAHKRNPQPDDLLFPTISKRRRNRGEQLCSHGEIYKRWKYHHLPAADLRHRRLHDSRRTFISIARSSGASKDITRAITHKVSGDAVLDAYTTLEWDALCREMSVIEWRLPGPPGASADVIVMGTRRKR